MPKHTPEIPIAQASTQLHMSGGVSGASRTSSHHSHPQNTTKQTLSLIASDSIAGKSNNDGSI